VILALDQGTPASRAIVFDVRGTIVGFDQREFRQHFPKPGRVEHDPRDLWRSQLETAHGALRNAGVAASDVVAIGITNQRETTLVWERRSGRPVHRAIVWQDRRTAARCAELPGELIRERTGLVPDPYFSATKLEWILGRTDIPQRELAFGTVDTWLVHRLTGGREHVTDRTNAARTMLYDLGAGAWDEGLCGLLRVPVGVLSEVRPSGSFFGETEAAVLGRSLPITGVAGDQQAALVGQTCFAPGDATTSQISVFGIGGPVIIGVAAVATGFLLMMLAQRRLPDFFGRKPEVAVPEPVITKRGPPG